MKVSKWPPDMSNLEKANGFDKFKRDFDIFCRTNNFKIEEMNYLLTMFNTFVFLNKTFVEDKE